MGVVVVVRGTAAGGALVVVVGLDVVAAAGCFGAVGAGAVVAVGGFVAWGGVVGFKGGDDVPFSGGSCFGGGGGGESTLTPPDFGGGAWVDVDCADTDPAMSIAAMAIEVRRIIATILPHG